MTSPSPARTPRPAGRLTAYQRRMRAIGALHHRRYAVQLTVAGLVVFAAVRHQRESSSAAPSVDALCPFGAVESLWTWLTTDRLLPKIHPSTLIVGLGLLISVPLMFLLIGFITYPLICLWAIVLHAIAAGKANSGEWYDPPLVPKFIR